MIRNFFLLLTFLSTSFCCVAQLDTTAKTQTKGRLWLNQSIVPAGLIGVGLFSFHEKTFISRQSVFEWRQKHFPNFKNHTDDYLQYAPVVAVYGLRAFGVKGKTDFANSIIILAKAQLLMAAMVSPVKRLSNQPRPNGNGSNTFPSGHTAQAFVLATFMHRELGHKSPYYSIAAFATATATGAWRILKNKHWISDVLIGAGIGILATNTAYLIHQYKWKRRKWIILPSYSNSAVGVHLQYSFG